MTFNEKLLAWSRQQDSLVCVGLDPELGKIPGLLLNQADPILAFGKAIIAATHPYVAAYKPNLAFYEVLGKTGWETLEQTLKFIPPGILKIADAKRGDIGNTSRLYAKAFFDYFQFDAITVNPYLGYDSVAPFLEDETRGVFVLCLTSNPGSQDFQYFNDGSQNLFQQVAKKVVQWNKKANCGLVVGATHPEELRIVRELAPDLPILVPGIGVQGGDLELSVKYSTNVHGELALFNSSRGIIYRSNQSDFAEQAAQAAAELKTAINKIRSQK
jgi:orotidine-5'-phosphate decarboxylase